MFKLRSLSQKKWHQQTILVRVDFNVPLIEKKGQLVVSDPRRIIASFATVDHLLSQGNKVVLLAHLGRPTVDDRARFSLAPIFRFLQEKTDWSLTFIENILDPDLSTRLTALPDKSVILLENLRFYPEEKASNSQFIQHLASLGSGFVLDAFSVCHRSHSSVVGLAKALPSVAGFALLDEVRAFSALLDHPRRPFVVVVGGAKISDKIDPIVNLAKIADAILIGGGVANNFLKAVGLAVQKSYLQDAPADLAKTGLNYVTVADQIIEDNRSERLLKDGYIPLPKIIYPVDAIAATSMTASRTQVVDLTDPDKLSNRGNLMYLDIGPKTTRLYKELILQAGTVFWNGPMGVFEHKNFATGTKEIARCMAKTSAVTLAGGGDTIAALDHFGFYHNLDYVSMAGSAALEFLSGKILPGLAALESSK